LYGAPEPRAPINSQSAHVDAAVAVTASITPLTNDATIRSAVRAPPSRFLARIIHQLLDSWGYGHLAYDAGLIDNIHMRNFIHKAGIVTLGIAQILAFSFLLLILLIALAFVSFFSQNSMVSEIGVTIIKILFASGIIFSTITTYRQWKKADAYTPIKPDDKLRATVYGIVIPVVLMSLFILAATVLAMPEFLIFDPQTDGIIQVAILIFGGLFAILASLNILSGNWLAKPKVR
jgi:hypothetical protein